MTTSPHALAILRTDAVPAAARQRAESPLGLAWAAEIDEAFARLDLATATDADNSVDVKITADKLRTVACRWVMSGGMYLLRDLDDTGYGPEINAALAEVKARLLDLATLRLAPVAADGQAA